ncbi:hypothetical protein EBBID32_45310 [Sphingobium indicum BiD32]|uniref:Bacteriophage tail tape measure N-terminal domain-containing protein n=1 Tax=Sphingobium indicum BiD32 TaxID=1301087 RepID=N1MSK1_9SPHN|nr:hypothetical protein [Sphingobium indicum]CCW20160.1 hypothetical protein EBBID32_45310 [Sphingobium indicum BiD32]
MTVPKVAIRLGTEGKEDVKRDAREVGDAWEASARRAVRAYDKAATDFESAERRRAAAAQKIAAIMPQTAVQMRINDAVGTGSSLQEGSARASAAAFRELFAEQERLTAGAAMLRAQIDPTWAAQQRFNNEMLQARTLIAAGSITLDEYCAKLRMEQVALNAVSGSHGRVMASSGAMRSGLQQAGFQVQDFLVQVQGGTSALRAFSQQAPQLIGNLQMMTHGAEAGAGRFAAFARVLGGPWGVALGIAIPAAAMLAEKLLASGDAAAEAQKATEKHKESIDALNQAMRASILTAQDRARTSYIEAESERLSAIQTRNKTQAMLEQAKVRAQNAQGSWIGANGPNGAQSVVANQYASEVERLERALKENQAAIKEQTATASIAQGQYIAQILRDMRTPEGRVNERYNQQINGVIRAGGDANAQAAAINRLEAARAAELKTIEQQADALRKSGSARRDGDAATTSQVSKLLLEAFGGTITSTTGGKHVKGSYHYKGQAVDFVPAGGMASISKDQIRAIADGAGLQIKELLGPGDKGHSDHFHLAWASGKGQMDSARIAGQMMAEEVRKSLALEKQRNEWINEQSLKVGDGAKAAFDVEGDKLSDRQKFFSAANDDISAGTVLLNLEWELRGKSRREIEAAVEVRRYQLDLEREGRDLTAEQVDVLVKAKAAQIAFTNALDDSNGRLMAMRDIGSNVVDTVLNPGNWSSWKNVAMSAINDVVSAMWKLAVINPIQNRISGGNLPTIGSLFGLLGGGSRAAAKGGSAIGNMYTPAGAMLVGENGPEIVNMPRGAQVMTASDTRRAMAGNDNGLQIRVIKGDLFDVEITRISAGVSAQVVGAAAPVIASGASNGAQQAVSRRNSRRLA